MMLGGDMCYYYDCEIKFQYPKYNRAITFLRIYQRQEGRERWARLCINEKVISQVKFKFHGTKNNLRKAHAIFIKQMNTAIRKAKKIYPNLQKA
jgi:hypothetical protein